MGRQSSRLYYNGKDHKDIYYNGKYHNAMYYKNQGGLIWQKLDDELNVGMSVISTKITDLEKVWGINRMIPERPEIESNIVKSYNYSTGIGDTAFDTIIAGQGRAFGYSNISKMAYAWVSSDGKYWKKYSTQYAVYSIYPCYDGFIYANGKIVSKVTLDSNDNRISEEVLSENFTIESFAHNGVWGRNEYNILFLTNTGNLFTYAADHEKGGESLRFLNNFQDGINSYVLIKKVIYGIWDEHPEYAMKTYEVLSSNGGAINSVMETYDIYEEPKNIVYRDGKFYYYIFGASTKVKSTTDFLNFTDVVEWAETDYIDLPLIGGELYSATSVRLYPHTGTDKYYNGHFIVQDGIAEAHFFIPDGQNFARFIGNAQQIPDAIFYEVPGYGQRNLDIYIDNPALRKSTYGFAFFTDNVGLGKSYP